MAANRLNRINEEVYRELATIIREMKDPRISSLVSVTGVSVTSDLRFCKVHISVLDEEKTGEILKVLKSAAGFIRKELGGRVQLRHTPELIFQSDDSIKHGAHISELLGKLEDLKNDD